MSARKRPMLRYGVKYRMNNLTLQPDNHRMLAEWLASDACVIACLCAVWCDTCAAYKSRFDELASLHPDQRFVWIDIEDQADVVGDLDIDNFPTLLFQRGNIVSFFGVVRPDLQQADRLLRAQLEKSHAELEEEATSSEERKNWQRNVNLWVLLDNADNAQY
jgi:thioredoxin 1